jgi:ABC-type transport system involved in multi-copper enzyme maturation permease subunit
MGVWIMAGITFREAARKKILWTALLAGLAFLMVFGIGLRFQVGDFRNSAVPPFLRYQVISAMLMIGLYTVDLLAVVMTTLTSVDTISGEITSGTIHAIATKPMARWQILIGKWLGFVAMAAVYVAIMFGGAIAEGYWIGGVMAQHPVRGGLLVFLECIVALSITFMFGTWLSTLTSGVITLGLLGVAFLGGWLEQMSGFTEGSRLAMVGIISSLVMPSEAIWRRAAFEMESPLSGSLQFSPFADVSIPSIAMIGYAILYLLIALSIAVYHFGERDL